MSYSIVKPAELPFTERPYRPQDAPRQVASLTAALGLENARASLWRYPPGVRGRRHREGAQEEVFACLEGTITLALGDPTEMIELPAGSFARVGTGTEIQVRNESAADAVVLAWGAPAVTGEAEILDDLP
ncbi:MAG TPA: cupin domain-containing protein [Gaiellales bacterium]